MIYSGKKGLQERLQLQVRRVRYYTKYCQARPENSIKERGILRGSSDLDLPQLLNTSKRLQAMKG